MTPAIKVYDRSMQPLIVLTTVGENFDARGLATLLVDERLTACVNIVPALYSVYRWEGKTTGDHEQLLVMKTASEKVEALRERLFALHPYEVPEFIVVAIDRIDDRYGAWLENALA